MSIYSWSYEGKLRSVTQKASQLLSWWLLYKMSQLETLHFSTALCMQICNEGQSLSPPPHTEGRGSNCRDKRFTPHLRSPEQGHKAKV